MQGRSQKAAEPTGQENSAGRIRATGLVTVSGSGMIKKRKHAQLGVKTSRKTSHGGSGAGLGNQKFASGR